jgi:hypothetical protein
MRETKGPQKPCGIGTSGWDFVHTVERAYHT